MSYFLYAETAFHHEGDEGYLKELIEAIAETGIQGIKFQVLIDVNEFASSRHKAYSSIGNWIFTLDQWRFFFDLALDRGLDLIMMPLDGESFHLTREFPISYLDLHSVSFHDPLVVKQMKSSGLPIILGTGGRTLDEIDQKIGYFSDQSTVLMGGFQSFPSDLQHVRLARLSFLKERYPESIIGYADHTSYDVPYAVTSLEYAFLLGARIFEKHVTLQEGRKRVDFEAAVGIKKLTDIKMKLDYLESLVTPSGVKSMEMTPAEIKYRERQKFAVACQNLEAGHVLRASDLLLKITDENLGYPSIDSLVGHKLNRAVCRDEVITKDIIL